MRDPLVSAVLRYPREIFRNLNSRKYRVYLGFGQAYLGYAGFI